MPFIRYPRIADASQLFSSAVCGYRPRHRQAISNYRHLGLLFIEHPPQFGPHDPVRCPIVLGQVHERLVDLGAVITQQRYHVVVVHHVSIRHDGLTFVGVAMGSLPRRGGVATFWGRRAAAFGSLRWCPRPRVQTLR